MKYFSISHFIFLFREIWIRMLPRYTVFSTYYPGFKWWATDKSSFLFMYKEIFIKEMYKFTCENDSPYIIDCGANVGLATAYFAKQFPKADIVCFEPDPNTFSILKKNVHNLENKDKINPINAAVGSNDGEMNFFPDGADGGSIFDFGSTENIMVEVVGLKPFLNKSVDFLKIDIEGAEFDLLYSIQPELKLVQRIFVEYHSFTNKEQRLGDILTILKQAGFRYYIEQVGVNSNEPYIKQNSYHGMDLQVNIFGYRDEMVVHK